MTSDGPIVIDGVFFERDITTGIARLWSEILVRWAGRDIARRIVLLNRGREYAGPKTITVREFPSFDQAQWEADQPRIQDVCDTLGAAVFLSTYYTLPLRTPSVLWVHDMIPERVGFDLTDPTWRQKRAAIEHAAAFACSSTSSLNDLREIVPSTHPKPAVVTGCGVSAVMHPLAEDECAIFHSLFVARKLGGRPFIFMPGHTHSYKNGLLLAEALAGMDCSNLAVLMTMGSPEVEERLRAIPGLIVHREFLDDETLRLAYGSAYCLVYPSYYEGFGLPVAEAMACGCPVICAGTSSLREVGGDAAILIDPREASQLAKGLKAVADGDLRARMIARGIVQAAKFSWDQVAMTLETLVLSTIQAGTR